MRKTVVLTPFHEEYLANTVAQVKDLLWAQFEKENKTSLKDETYLYKMKILFIKIESQLKTKIIEIF